MVRLVTDYLDDSVLKHPDKIAFGDEKREITFLQVQTEAMHIASSLIDCDVFKKPVVVYLDKSVEVLVSFMGAAYSGNFYTPIDTSMPVTRIEKIIETLTPSVIITDTEHAVAAHTFAASAKVMLYTDLMTVSFSDKKIQMVTERLIDTDILYVLFTSG